VPAFGDLSEATLKHAAFEQELHQPEQLPAYHDPVSVAE
jgi:hypothetical protein